MQSRDASLREGLEAIAAEAGPLDLATEPVVAKVRRRRRRRAVLGTAAGAVAIVLATMTVTSWIRGSQSGGLTMGGSAEPSIAVPSDPSPRVYMCGQRLVLTDAASSRMGLTMAISSVRRTADDTGPSIAVTFTADTPMQINSSPPTLFEVLYLKDGIIVGGGPMLNMPGDESSQGLDLIGFQFEVAPGHPSIHDLGPRNTLCPSSTWQQVWSTPQSYEVVVLQGPVEGVPQQTSLGVPMLDGPLLTSRTSLPR